MTDEDEIAEDAPTPQWVVDSEDKAAWAIDRLLSREADVVRVKAAAANAIARAEKELARARDFFLPQLVLWSVDHPPRRGKTLHFVTGSLSATTTAPRVKIADEKALIAWADANEGLSVRTVIPPPVRSVAHADVVALLSRPGTPLPPGVEIVPSTTTYKVTGPKEEK